MTRRGKTPGIVERHSRSCASRAGGKCDCTPSYMAWTWDARAGRKIYKTFAGKGAKSAAKAWRADAVPAVRKGTLRAPTKALLRDAAEQWLAAAERGEVLSRYRRPYKPSALRGYRADLERYVYPELGGLRLSEVTADDLQALVERLNAQGLSGAKVRNVLVPLQALYRHNRRRVPVDPTEGLDLPAAGGRRERAATPEEAAELLRALPEEDQPLWATAFYAGLRRGELRALRWRHVRGLGTEQPVTIAVEASWDDVAGEVEPKSLKGTRTVPVPEVLRPYLEAHRLRRASVAAIAGDGGNELVFGRTPTEPFTPSAVRRRALAAWSAENRRRLEAAAQNDEPPPRLLEPIRLHECRHTYVSLMHAAGVPLERIGDYVGHSSTYMTDRYRHLLRGQAAADAARLDEYVNGRLAD